MEYPPKKENIFLNGIPKPVIQFQIWTQVYPSVVLSPDYIYHPTGSGTIIGNNNEDSMHFFIFLIFGIATMDTGTGNA